MNLSPRNELADLFRCQLEKLGGIPLLRVVRFLADQEVYAATERRLQKLGHDVLTARALGMSQADDTKLLAKAAQEQRIFVSRDRDLAFPLAKSASDPGRRETSKRPVLELENVRLLREIPVNEDVDR